MNPINADVNSGVPVGILSGRWCSAACEAPAPGLGLFFRATRQYKQRWQGYGTGFSGKPSSEPASSAHPEAEAVATLLFFPFFYVIRKFCNYFICLLFGTVIFIWALRVRANL